MAVKIVSVDINDKKVLRDLLWEYQREILDKDPGEYKYLDGYWEKPDRHPFFIFVDKKTAGFVLVNCHTLVTKDAKNISEFYIKKEYRHQDIGRQAAFLTFNLFPGKWEVRQIKENPKAHEFWTKVISDYTNANFREVIMNNENWHGWVQTFSVK